jgi:hypothetical protein
MGEVSVKQRIAWLLVTYGVDFVRPACGIPYGDCASVLCWAAGCD